MKKLIVILALIIACAAAFAVKFDPYWFQPRTVIACFTKDAIPNIDGKISYTIVDGIVQTGLPSFDALAKKYQIVELRQAHPYVKVPTWHSNGAYLQNVYRIILAENDNIDAAVTDLSKESTLVYAELEAINRTKFVPNDPMLSQQYVHPRIQSYDAWDYVQGSHDVIVSITDSGVKWNHPDLRNNIWVNPAEAPGMTINWTNGTISGGNGQDAGEGGGKADDLLGWDFYSNDNNPYQGHVDRDHGTHVAGCAGAVGNNAIGISGTSPIVSILSCKGAPETGGDTGVAYGYDQIKYSAEIGAAVINASWGGPGNGTYPNQVVTYAKNLGALVVAAAGNENLEHNSSYQDYPADCTDALNVAATNANDIKTSFSDYGETIDISAPGIGILSTIIGGNGYDSYQGTSMSSPIVAGVAALVKALHPTMTPDQLRNRLMITADPIDHLNQTQYAEKLGTGRVNAFTATMYDKIPNITIEQKLVEEFSGDNDGIANPGDTVTIKAEFNNPLTGLGITWQNATNLIATLRTNYPGVTIIDSISTVGMVFAASSTWNTNSPFKLRTISGLPSEAIPFEMIVTANQTAAFPYYKVFPFTVNLSLNQAGWPINLGGASQSSPILVDINNDSKLEVVYADHAGIVSVKSPAGGTSQASGFPLNLGAATVGSIAMSNLQNNGTYGFAASLSNSNVVAFNSNGTLLWTSPAGGVLRSGPVIATLTDPASPKVIAATQNGKIVAFNPDGTSVPNFPVTLTGAFMASPSVADLTGDGNLEIIAVSGSGTVNAINPLTGENISGFPVTLNGGSQNAVTIANLDSDPHPEILIATSTTGFLYALNHDGSILFQKNIGSAIKTSPIVADINNDGNKEIILITGAGVVYIMSATGTDLPNTPISVYANVECTPVVARFDGNNNAGIIFGDSNGYLHSVRIDGTESPNFPIFIGGNVKYSAALADIDRDGDLDIVLPNNTGFYTIDIKRSAQSIEWACYLGSYNRAGNIYQATPNSDVTAPAMHTSLGSAYPNPFNPSTTISFSLADNADVTLEIFNKKGQKIKSLVNSTMAKGTHQVVWNGTDDNDNSVSSGLYLYRMRSGKYSSTRKMIMMK